MTNYVFYHADCIDGFTAAWCFHRAGGYTLIPLKWDESGEEWRKTRQAMTVRPDDDVIFVDVSIPPNDVVVLAREVRSVRILDHHKTARDDWNAACPDPDKWAQEHGWNVTAHFDLTKSGAMLAWHYLNDAPAPALVRYVQDRDLWKKELPFTEEINAYISAQPYTFEAYNEIHGAFLVEGTGFAQFGGESILLAKQKVIDEMVRKAQDFELLGVNVKAVNYGAAHGISEIGHELAKLSRDGCGLVWRIEGDKVECSLRGHNGRDVSVIAKAFGGGGHPGAAGFRLPLKEWLISFDPKARRFIDVR